MNVLKVLSDRLGKEMPIKPAASEKEKETLG